MFRFPLLLALICFTQILQSQSVLSRVTFPVDDQQTTRVLAQAGLDLTHGHTKSQSSFTTEIQDFQFKRLDALGIRYTIDIPDLSAYRKSLQQQAQRGTFLECQDHSFDEIVPKNFEPGSVGGYFSLPEVLDHLDAMAILYPDLVSIRRPIGNFKTWQNNSIFWVKLSDNPEVDENEPEILYTGLHHARELISVSQSIYYMWYLLENYEKDPVIRQILDHTELYFVPVVNPDGLNYNIAGYDPVEDVFTRNHRKNMRDNDDNGTFDPEEDGVDLNRNYSFEWGHDDEGSSGFAGSDTYRGPDPLSEPETQAIAFFCQQHDFRLALNYHSYGNLLIYPWGYNDAHTPDSIAFSHYGELLTKRNGYVYGLGEETVGYPTNGDSDDYMYGEHGIFSMTPEIGDPDDGFYPLQERIIPLCQSALEMNLLAARLVNSLIEITDETPQYIKPGENALQLGFNRYGLLDEEVEISFNPISPEILEVPSPFQIDLAEFEPFDQNFTFTVDHQIQYGTRVRMEVVIRQGEYIFRDTLEKVRADFETLVESNGDLSEWDNSAGMQWGTTSSTYKSGPVSIADSPAGLYGPDVHESILLEPQIDLSNTTEAYAQFWAKWEIEDHYDYVVFQASTDGEQWENLCGEQSKLGSLFQLYEEPLYDGKQVHWVLENVDLSSYIGQVIQLRFLIVTDGFVHMDGFYFDNFKVIKIREEAVATDEADASSFSVFPNPAGQSFTLKMPPLTRPHLVVTNSMGQPVYTGDIRDNGFHTVLTGSWPSGLYHFRLYADHKPVHAGTISVVR